jgi:KDO2-lipid IV(A) lauroyltransferase
VQFAFGYIFIMIQFLLFRFFVAFFWCVPFPLLYFWADVLAFCMFKVFKYRRTIVENNLLLAFPEKTPEARHVIAQKFYTHLADLFLEGIKGMSMTDAQLMRRFFGSNVALINQQMDHGKSTLLLAGHYGNWEWAVAACGVQTRHTLIGLYKPLRNQRIEKWVKTRRQRCGLVLASIGDTPATFEQYKHKPSCYIMMADQNPSNPTLAHWIKFLNQDTACLHGPDKYARQTGYAVYYAQIYKVRRGYYQAHLELLHNNEAPLRHNEITEKFMNRLEKTIVDTPEYWLWTHKRWKHKRP